MVILGAHAEGKEPVEEVDKFVAKSCNMSHSVTGEKPSKLLFNRDIADKLPRLPTTSKGRHHQKARKRDQEAKQEMKIQYDSKYKTKLVEMKIGDWAYR